MSRAGKNMIIDAMGQKHQSAIVLEHADGWKLQERSTTSQHRPLIGGIQVYASMLGPSTLSFNAIATNGIRGFVTSGHASWLNYDVHQGGGTVGTVLRNPQGNGYRLSDAAFVGRYTGINLRGRIYPTNLIYGRLNSTSQPVGLNIRMHGYKSGTTTGRIRSKHYTGNSAAYGELRDQILADYKDDYGDSGAPVTYRNDEGQTIICGVHVGVVSTWLGTRRVYSPIEHVLSELSLSREIRETDGIQ